jgi:hypothetical protein
LGINLKNKHVLIMKTALMRCAVVGCLYTFAPSLSAQNTLTPLQKEWLKTWMHLVKLSKMKTEKVAQNDNSAMPCAVSNEITIVVGPCLQTERKENASMMKPVQ